RGRHAHHAGRRRAVHAAEPLDRGSVRHLVTVGAELAPPPRSGRASSAPTDQSLTQVTSDQIRGTFTFSIEIGSRPAWTRNAGRSRSDLNPRYSVAGAIIRSSHAP